MNKSVAVLGLTALLGACGTASDPIVGEWEAVSAVVGAETYSTMPASIPITIGTEGEQTQATLGVDYSIIVSENADDAEILEPTFSESITLDSTPIPSTDTVELVVGEDGAYTFEVTSTVPDLTQTRSYGLDCTLSEDELTLSCESDSKSSGTNLNIPGIADEIVFELVSGDSE